MPVTVRSNRHWRPFCYRSEVPEKILADQFDYLSEDDLYASVDEFAYIWYNHVRPHSYNGYKTPFEARTGISNY